VKKGIIVIGSQGSGKTIKIRELVKQVPVNQLVWINPTKSDTELKRLVKPQTTTIVIEGVVSLNEMVRIQNYVREGICLSKNGKDTSTIFPKIIASTCSLLVSELANFEHDFEIIELKDRF
jgi:ABC-type dipeptide/oligopeptide/nickel transport system ATPase component